MCRITQERHVSHAGSGQREQQLIAGRVVAYFADELDA
jgi:hypothetical protein